MCGIHVYAAIVSPNKSTEPPLDPSHRVRFDARMDGVSHDQKPTPF